MLTIRLQRIGRRNSSAFRLVLTDSHRAPQSGGFHEVLGSYNPHSDDPQIDTERAAYWIERGAQTSGTVHNLLVSAGVISGDKKNVLPQKSPVVSEEESSGEDSAAESSADEGSDEAADVPEEATDEAADSTPEQAADESEEGGSGAEEDGSSEEEETTTS